MKKTIALLAALSLSVSLLAGCGSSASSSAASSSEAASSEAASSSTAADGDLDYIKGNGKMVIGYTVYAPMNYTDDEGNFTGFDTELATAVCLAKKDHIVDDFVFASVSPAYLSAMMDTL